MQILIVSHVVHYAHGGRIHAYGPYAREIDLWAQLFSEVVIAAPCRHTAPSGDCVPLAQSNIRLAPQREAGGETFLAKLSLMIALPSWIWRLSREMFRADAVHVRCPGNIGLVGSILAPLFSRRLVAKYAGLWGESVNEPWSFGLQRRILGSRWWRGPVTVYGRWPNQRSHVTPFFTSLLTTEQIERGRRAASGPLSLPLRILYTGRLSRAKNVHVLLEAIAGLRENGIESSCTIIGDGPERESLNQLSRRLGLGETVHFTGGLAFEQVIPYLERSQVLVLVSDSEGWPKSAAEAMAFGLVCVGSDIGFLKEMLGGGRGIAVPPGDVQALTNALVDIAAHPEQYEEMRRLALEWSARFSIEGLREALRTLLETQWNVRLEPRLPAGHVPAAPVSC
ncbi:MAG: glycosyltransferase family 4 protein [Bryobacterales bacterium]|nr:glycosyltransferase family 4 protein [Bryobacterales bacterium]